MRRISVIDAPSNLGLSAPKPGTVPGCHKLPWVFRDNGFVTRLSALDAGAVVPPRYDNGDWRPGDGVRQAAAIARYTGILADRITRVLDQDHFPVVLGGDCSIVLGAVLALRRRGRFGLAYLDGADFRHPGNAEYVGAAAGECLALATGRGQHDLTDIDGLGPYVRDEDVVLLGMRDDDELRSEVEAVLTTVTASQIITDGPAAARRALAGLESDAAAGFWVHVDADVLDPTVMPCVDTPEPGGLDFDQLRDLLAALLASTRCVGAQITIFDPDKDPDGSIGAAFVDAVVAAFDDHAG